MPVEDHSFEIGTRKAAGWQLFLVLASGLEPPTY
jgi:hypothetical protein